MKPPKSRRCLPSPTLRAACVALCALHLAFDARSAGHEVSGRDLARVLAHASLKSGHKVADLMPGDGELTRALCKLVGDTGHVYAVSMRTAVSTDTSPSVAALAPDCMNVTVVELKPQKRPAPELWSSSDDPGAVYEYWSFTPPAAETFALPEKVDLILISQGYAELRTAKFDSPNIQLVNRALWSALESGGMLIVGTATEAPNHERRVDTSETTREFVAAGFEVIDESAEPDRLLRFRKP